MSQTTETIKQHWRRCLAVRARVVAGSTALAVTKASAAAVRVTGSTVVQSMPDGRCVRSTLVLMINLVYRPPPMSSRVDGRRTDLLCACLYLLCKQIDL